MELSSVWICLCHIKCKRTHFVNNQIDLLSIVTSGVQESEVPRPDGDILGVAEGWEDDETRNPKVPAISHTRGLTPFVFVPFEEVCLLRKFI